MLDGTMTPPQDGGPPGDDDLVARVIPLRRRSDVGDGELLTASPPTSASGPRDESGEPTPAVAHRDMWAERASRLRVREPAVTGGRSSSLPHAASDAGRRLRIRGASHRVLGGIALAALLVAVAAVAVASSGSGHVVARRAHVVSESASAAAKASAARTAAARAAAARAALRAAQKRASASAARKRASGAARVREVALAHARAIRAKKRAQALARGRAAARTPASRVGAAAPVATQTPVVAHLPPPVVVQPKRSTPLHSSGSGGGCAAAVPGELGC
jgi:ABC-2 type transport system ATP-binding protein